MHLTGNELARAAWTQAWQVTLLIVVVGLLVRLFARNRPYLGHVLWLVVLIKCVTPPVFVSSSGIFCWMQAQADERSTPLAMAEDPPVGRWAVVDTPDLRPAVEMEHVLEPVAEPSGGRMVVENTVLNTPRIETTAPDVDRAKLISWTLLGGWFVGSIVMLGVMVVRWIVCLQRIRPIDRPVDASYDRMVRSLSRRLRLWRRVRLVVTESRIGPAVIGLFRPTVLLPEILVREQSAEELEPILAHELIHIRRGDAWVGLLQMMVRVVWWFHPLVWWADRLVAREAERCCDEAVVAELGCSPARYARCLFDVLQRKLVLNPLPACPGVRPVEVTSKRMERIMKLGQRSLKRSPWWCWAVMLLALAATLPGAALVAGDGDNVLHPRAIVSGEENNDPSAKQPLGLYDAPPAPHQGIQSATASRLPTQAAKAPLIRRVHQVDDLLAKARSEKKLNRQEAREYLLALFLENRHTRFDSRGRIAWAGKKLEILAPSNEHEHFEAILEVVRKHGLGNPCVDLDVVFMEMPPEAINALNVEWTVNWNENLPGVPVPRCSQSAHRQDLVPKKATFSDPLSFPGNQARFVVEKNLPGRFAILDSKRLDAVLEVARQDRDCSVFASPKLRAVRGRTAWLRIGGESPFVIGADGDQPIIRVVSEGTRVRIRPDLVEEDTLQLDYELVFSKILEVETVCVSTGPDHKPKVTVQVPEVETARLVGSAKLSADRSLLIVGPKTKDADGNAQSMLVMIRAAKVATKPLFDKSVPENPVPPLQTQLYDVADLVRPASSPWMPPPGQAKTRDKPAAEPDFDALISWITQVVAPRSWKKVGGRGTIKAFKSDSSLVVSQTESAHEEIAESLAQLQRHRDIHTKLEIKIVHVPKEPIDQLGITFDTLTLREPRVFEAFFADSKSVAIHNLASGSFYNGQLAGLPVTLPGAPAGSGWLMLSAFVNEDRREVHIGLLVVKADLPDNPSHRDIQKVLTKPEALMTQGAFMKAVNVPDGSSVLIDVTDHLQWPGRVGGAPKSAGSKILGKVRSKNDKTFLLVTPRIIIQEEEEERLGILSNP